MRFKIEGNIIEKTKIKKTNYKHEIYSMILNNLSIGNSNEIHSKNNFKLFTFSNIYIQNNKFHLYVSGLENIMLDFTNHIIFNELVRIDDMILKVTKITPMEELNKKDKYCFKSDVIINISKNKKCVLTEDFDFFCKRINQIAKDKYKKIYKKESIGNIDVEILKINKICNKYKDHHLFSWKTILQLTGDFDLINLIYNVGIGENTASGHGFLWEINS